MTTFNLMLDFLHYWQSGSGLSGGAGVDAQVIKDANQLPYFPGRTLKGLLRDAFLQAETWGWLDEVKSTHLPEVKHSLVDLLFGQRGGSDDISEKNEHDRSAIHAGILLVSDARLSKQEQDWLNTPAGQPYKAKLTQDLFSTAIEGDGARRGVAIDKSLRGVEVSVPMQLHAELTVQPPLNRQVHFTQSQQLIIDTLEINTLINKVLPLIESAGGKRTRGLGRVDVTLQERAKT